MQFVCVEGQKLNEVSNTLSAPKLLIKHACCQQISNVKLWFSYGNQSSSRIDSPVSYFRLYFHPYENSFALNQLMQSKFSTINNFIVPCELHLYQLSVIDVRDTLEKCWMVQCFQAFETFAIIQNHRQWVVCITCLWIKNWVTTFWNQGIFEI